ncbi:efflux RND transporter periplasmic adaptor subunit [Geomesophilobacter sediminis]|uniref:efflux RND transporter periplasmic adaptor subunit n=1 Tax=Geomesophilobacter sediminis TaxID=2798584 RepID=UPI002E2E449D|nr:efflux RND transporter periplasmic adaptor subunit [Geomesophilobacter sediminis]
MKKLILVLVPVVAVLAVAGFFLFKKSPKPQYKTVKIERGSIVSTVSATGTINAVVNVQVGTQVSGTIAKLYVDFNSPVRKGQAIAQIDPALFISAVEQARGNHLNALANVGKAKVVLADAKRTLGRNQKLLEQGIVSQSDLDVAQTAYDTAVAGLSSAEAQVLQTKGALRQAETNLTYSTIRSPVDGIIVSRAVDVGQTVAASFQTPTLFTIAQDLTKMQIETSVDESDISRVRLGQSANFTVDAYPELQFTGTVSQIRNAPVVTQNVVTYVTVISVDNRDLKLKPGMTANVSIVTQKKDGVLKIPSAALRFKPKADKDEKGKKTEGAAVKPSAAKAAAAGKSGAPQPMKPIQHVYQLTPEGTPRAVSVETGISDSKFVEMANGELKEGDEVVVEQVTTGKKAMGSPMGPRF